MTLPLHIRRMTRADVPLGMRLKRQAGWNQLEADWIRALELEPEGCFVAESAAQAVATATTCTFGASAWVALVLVEEKFRGHGIGTALMRHALDFLDQRRIETTWLDATPLGQPVYEKLGFVPEFTLARYSGRADNAGSSPHARPIGPEDIGALVEMDRLACGCERGKFLSRLIREAPDAGRTYWREGKPAGFLLARRGENAVQIGPCVADHVSGPVLLTDALSRFASEPVYVDVPIAHVEAVELAATHGLVEQRRLLRMRRGNPVPYDPSLLWASSGPEKG